ncbi:MAG: histidinol-phosphate transaminase [Candidatus Omnitrophica bacterium]|jgi:histidinol-phosphate aminotransferase|nr:histidinol-phosphate transaminase [Candidatus Omnitrophota bacterium]
MICRKELKKVNNYKPGKPIEEVKRALKIKEVYKLASNEIPFRPLYLRKAINQELNNINRYPESNCFYLRQKLSKKLGVQKEQLIFGNGSDELITLCLRAIINSGDEVIVSYPTFLIYEIQAKIQNAKVVKVPLENYRYSLNKIAERVNKNTKIIFIANPDNPTGTYLNHNEVKNFLNNIPKKVLVYFDEAYFEFAPIGFPQTLKFLKQRGNILITRTFSKAYGLAGLRIGYGITSKEIANCLNKIRDPFNINRLAQVSAVSALENISFSKKIVEYINKEKKYLYRELGKCNLSFVKSATNFILVNFDKDVSFLSNYLLKQGVIIRELKSWGLKNCFRVTVGLHKENKKFIVLLRDYLKKKT